jgi:succinate-semialdehyde dehydrogenase/glutarate-semialdehyde dehydrogenase
MSTYAVVNPATGEKVKEYPEISDGDLRAAIGRAEEASRTWSRSSTVAERASSWPRSPSARWASRSSRR